MPSRYGVPDQALGASPSGLAHPLAAGMVSLLDKLPACVSGIA